jgi:hypothetical protein
MSRAPLTRPDFTFPFGAYIAVVRSSGTRARGEVKLAVYGQGSP